MTYKSEVLFPLHRLEFFILERMRILFSIFVLITQQFSIGHQGSHDQAGKNNLKTGILLQNSMKKLATVCSLQ